MLLMCVAVVLSVARTGGDIRAKLRVIKSFKFLFFSTNLCTIISVSFIREKNNKLTLLPLLFLSGLPFQLSSSFLSAVALLAGA